MVVKQNKITYTKYNKRKAIKLTLFICRHNTKHIYARSERKDIIFITFIKIISMGI